MGLFDNIFLDKDTPTALLDNPEIKPPDGTPKKQEAKVPYDPKNDPIAPAVQDEQGSGGSEPGEKNSGDVSFDIGGDLDFTSIGTAETATGVPPSIEPTSESVTPTAGSVDSDAFTVDSGAVGVGAGAENVSSIAMIQGGTASVIDGIDIGGISGIEISGADSASLEGTTINSGNGESISGTGGIDIEIHSIEDHHTEGAKTGAKDGEDGIFGLMDTELVDTKVKASSLEVEGKSEITDITEAISSPIAETTDTITIHETEHLAEVVEEEKGSTLSFDILGSPEIPTIKSERGGRIQELIQKLIDELKLINQEEEAAEVERKAKIASITTREAELEHEYTTRKEALKYEKLALEKPADKTTEKNRIKSLIASFEEDLI